MKKVYVVGIGPGNAEGMTGQAVKVLNEAELLVGYNRYIELVRPLFPDKPVVATGMTHESERCRAALEAAVAGKTVAVVCSGDPGVYGMAGLVYELAAEYSPVDIEVIPGVSAAMAGAALLGAPLMHDFAVISLSDLLTPWETIARRLQSAASADFSICLYNPASHKRTGHLRLACDIILEHRQPDTVCGWVRNVGRTGCESGLLPLSGLREWRADMFCTIYIGNSSTSERAGKMVTPRGYGSRI